MANELITWLRGKTLILALLREAQIANTGVGKAVIRAVLTRWTAHYQAYKRLLELRENLISIIASDAARPTANKLIVTGDAKAIAHSRKMIEIVNDSLFWLSIARFVELSAPLLLLNLTEICISIKRHLEPLAIAANVTQASFCRLDTVLLTFGFLMMQYRNMTDPEDHQGCQAIMASLEKRWAVSDQELFIASIIINPFYRSKPFARLYVLNNASIQTLLCHLWSRFFKTPIPDDFYTELEEYLTSTSRYTNLDSHCQISASQAMLKVDFNVILQFNANYVIANRERHLTQSKYIPTAFRLQASLSRHSKNLLVGYYPYVPTLQHANVSGVSSVTLSLSCGIDLVSILSHR